MKIDLFENIHGCKNFMWSEVLYLHDLDVYVFPDVEQYNNLILITNVLQKIRNKFQVPINVTSALRPTFYNKMIGGASRSKHIIGAALDFKVQGHSTGKGCNYIRLILLLFLDKFKIRMENKPDSNWVHIDLEWKENGNNFFRP